jgi:hypothetical protein
MMDGREIDLIPDDESFPRTHSAVRERQLGDEISFAAVYPSLRSGLYRVQGSNQRIEIIGGSVTVVDFDE